MKEEIISLGESDNTSNGSSIIDEVFDEVFSDQPQTMKTTGKSEYTNPEYSEEKLSPGDDATFAELINDTYRDRALGEELNVKINEDERYEFLLGKYDYKLGSGSGSFEEESTVKSVIVTQILKYQRSKVKPTFIRLNNKTEDFVGFMSFNEDENYNNEIKNLLLFNFSKRFDIPPKDPSRYVMNLLNDHTEVRWFVRKKNIGVAHAYDTFIRELKSMGYDAKMNPNPSFIHKIDNFVRDLAEYGVKTKNPKLKPISVLAEWCKVMVAYKYQAFDKTLTAQEFMTFKEGTCYDVTNWAHHQFKNIPHTCVHITSSADRKFDKKRYWDSKNLKLKTNCHAFPVFGVNDEFWVFEASWKTHAGFRRFQSLPDAIYSVVLWVKDADDAKSFFVQSYVPDNQKWGYVEFCKKLIMDEGMGSKILHIW